MRADAVLSPLTSEVHRSIFKGKEHKPSCPQSGAGPALSGEQGTAGNGRGVHMASEVGCIYNFCYPANVKSH